MPNISSRRRRRLASGVGTEYITQWGDELDLRAKVYPINDKYLTMFEDEMDSDGVEEMTLRRHLANAELYLDKYLLERESLQMPDGPAEFAGFMTRVYIKNPENVDPAGVKNMCASIQKFYHCMMKNDRIFPADYQELCRVIRDNQTEWMAFSRHFGRIAHPDDPDYII